MSFFHHAANMMSSVSVVVTSSKSISGFEISPSDSDARVTVNSDGDLYQQIDGGAATSYETWLDTGLNSQVWVQRSIVSGSLDFDAGSGRLACTSNRTFGVEVTGIGLQTCVIDLNFYNAASGGILLDTQRVTLEANVEP